MPMTESGLLRSHLLLSDGRVSDRKVSGARFDRLGLPSLLLEPEGSWTKQEDVIPFARQGKGLLAGRLDTFAQEQLIEARLGDKPLAEAMIFSFRHLGQGEVELLATTRGEGATTVAYCDSQGWRADPTGVASFLAVEFSVVSPGGRSTVFMSFPRGRLSALAARAA
jgi:hypothetical protein